MIRVQTTVQKRKNDINYTILIPLSLEITRKIWLKKKTARIM